jgi:YfiH family protein
VFLHPPRSASGQVRTVHKAEAAEGDRAEAPSLCDPCDGQVTDEAGVLVAVATADCVPVFLVDPVTETVGAVHAGWRGAAAGVLEQGLAGFVDHYGSSIADVHVHLGPAICDACYEVGPEVFEALGQDVPDAPTPIDLRGILAARAMTAGIAKEQITISTHCTRCSESNLFSHRGGDVHRQVGYIARRMPVGSRHPDDVT